MAPFITRVVDTIPLLEICIEDVSSPRVKKLAIDLEGISLSRNGRISLVQVLADNSNIIWLVDITTLGSTAFSHLTPREVSLKIILEAETTTKLLFDVRNDADALYNLYGIEIRNVYDLQLLEIAVKRSNKLYSKRVLGLSKSIEGYVKPGDEWKQVKEEGAKLLFPDKGGSYDLLERRPLDQRVIAYASQDVSLLFRLERVLEHGIGGSGLGGWKKRVMKASLKRVGEAKSVEYNNDPKKRVLAPKM